MKTTTPPERAAAVLAWLRSLKNDRGALANLRCALTPTRRHRAWPLLARVGGIDDPITETVAALYAYHPVEASNGSLGDTCRQLAGTHNSFDGRFRRLLACDRNELCERLRPIVLAAKAKSIPVNYQTLVEDLSWWGERVRIRWAEAFWAGGPEEAAATKEAA